MAAHVFYTPPTYVPAYSPRDDVRRQYTMPQQQQPQEDLLIDTSVPPPRNDSLSSSSSSPSPSYDPAARRNSALAAHRNPRTFSNNIRTRSIAGPFGSGGVVFERDLPEPTDDDIIIVTVRLQNPFRRSSVEGAESLPNRPPARSFLRRISTRLSIDHSAEKEERYKAVKMPRGEYKRYFARDKDGNYAGTEPEKHWDEQELMKVYGEYQSVPLHSILC